MPVRSRSAVVSLLALLVIFAAALLSASRANAAAWTQPDYLYRYFVWGAQFPFTSRSDDYRHYGFHTIDKAPTAFQFARGSRDAVPDTVEYKDGEIVKRVALPELLRSTSTHAFIVVRDNEVLYEDYFNGYARDSLCTAWSVSKSVTSALVGIAISEGHIKSIDDPITNYLPELKGRGYDSITIKNLLTMGSGIRYRINFFSVGRICAGRLLSRFAAATVIGPDNHGAAGTGISLQQLQRRTYRHDPGTCHP